MSLKEILIQKQKQNDGFSLVELVIVIAIMAVLVAVIAPNYLRSVERARKTSDAYEAGGMVDVLNKAFINEEISFSDNDSAVWIFVNADGATAYVGGSTTTPAIHEVTGAAASVELKNMMKTFGYDLDEVFVTAKNIKDTGDRSTEVGWSWYCVYMCAGQDAYVVSSAASASSDYVSTYSSFSSRILSMADKDLCQINKYM